MTSLSDTLVGSLGSDAVAPPERLREHSVDGVTPEAAVFPEKVEAISEVLSLSAREGKFVTPWGGGTQMALGNTPRGVDLVLGLSRLNQILFHEPADLVASVEAGITLNALQEELARKGQFLPLEAPLPSRATIGGILAANASGPSRLAYGTPRDWLIGIKVVHSDGAVTKSGGKVVKNVTGYDLNKLYTGSLGTLGVIVEATFKIAPLPPDRGTLIATYPSLSAAMDSAQELLHQSFTPHALQVINREIMGRLPGLDVSGGEEAAVLALFAGRRLAVKRKVDESARVMERDSTRAVETLSQGDGDGLWQAVTDLGWAEEGLPQLVAKVTTLPSQVRDVLEMAGSLAGPPLSQGLVADVGSGLVRFLWWAEERLSSTTPLLSPLAKGGLQGGLLDDVISKLREGARHYTGHVVVERCPLEVKSKIDVWGDPLEGVDIMRRIKQELDPAGILNPGRFAGRI